MNINELNDELKNILLPGVIKEELLDDTYQVLYINKETFEKLWNLREKKAQELINAGEKEKNAYKDALPINLINPIKDGVVLVNFTENKAYSLVKDKEKVEKYVIKAFIVWANHQRKISKENVKKITTDETEIKKYMDKVEENIKEVEKELNFYLKNKDYEIIFTTYNTLKPENRYSKYMVVVTSDGKTERIRLRKKAINVAYTVDRHIEKRQYPTFIEKELAAADKVLFDKIFIKKKK